MKFQGMSAFVFEDLQRRGLIQDHTGEELAELLNKGKAVLYAGIDPTAKSLQVGNLLVLLLLLRLASAGNEVIVLIGGGTALIGDPGGKEEERELLDKEVVVENAERMKNQVVSLFERAGRTCRVLDNREWLTELNLVSFLREVGKAVSLNQMLAKESVKRRIEEGFISYAEFSYMLLQAYDYLVLHDRLGCNLQVGGSDQWGNITVGIELIRKLRGTSVHGLTLPLFTRKDGTKFGKTEAGTIWLDPNLTTPFDFYQFWLRLEDDLALLALPKFSLKPLEEVEKLAEEMKRFPASRVAQRALAEEMTALVHGEESVKEAKEASLRLFHKSARELSLADLEEIAKEDPPYEVEMEKLEGALSVAYLAREAGVCSSISEARRIARQGGLYLNDERVEDADRAVGRQDLIQGSWLVLRAGKRRRRLVRFV